VSRNITPRPVRAQGARDAHGKILDAGAGALYVHMHREAGLAHRHYVLKPWQVRLLAFVTSRPMLLLYLIGIVSWGWLASQAARVPLLQGQVSSLTADARRLDTLSAALTELQSRYDHVQRLLGTEASSASVTAAVRTTPPRNPTRSTPAKASSDSSARSKAIADSVSRARAIADSVTRAKVIADSLRDARERADSTAKATTRTDTTTVRPLDRP
jgi:hypothetical protein